MPDLTPTEDDLARDIVADLEEFERLMPDPLAAYWMLKSQQADQGAFARRAYRAAARRAVAERARADRLQALLDGVPAGDVRANAVGYVVEVRHAMHGAFCSVPLATLDDAETLAACINELIAAAALARPHPREEVLT